MEFSKEIYKNREESLKRWVKDYAGAILQTCLYLMPDQKQAEDAIQVTLIKAWRYQGNGKRITNERMWLLRIANNTCKDYLREGQQHHADDQFSLEEMPPKMLCIDSKETRIMLIVLKLPDTLRKTVLLYYFQGMTKQEIAEFLNISTLTVYRRLRLGVEILHTVLKEESSNIDAGPCLHTDG